MFVSAMRAVALSLLFGLGTAQFMVDEENQSGKEGGPAACAESLAS